MYVLQLNDMRFAQIEMVTAVRRSESILQLQQFMMDETVEPYNDGHWSKSYRKDGPLEWFNVTYDINNCIVDMGTEESWAENARQQFKKRVMSIQEV